MWLLDALEERKNDDATAIVYRNEKINFKELWQRSESIAQYLLNNGYNKNPLVIYGNKEIDIIPCMHAALKVGVPYVPVDTLYPVARLNKIADICEADLIINFSVESGFGRHEINQEELKEIYTENNGTSDRNLWVKDDDICYILFTSGSTGEPKGVPISKGNLINFADWFIKYIKLANESNGVINQAPYSFDLSVIGLFVCLPMGKYLLNIDKTMSGNYAELSECLSSNHPGIWISTPSFFDVCTYEKAFYGAAASLKLILFDGEVFPKKLAHKIFDNIAGVRVVNAYGPTEATVAISGCEIIPAMLDDDLELPIGYLLDDGVMQIAPEYTINDGTCTVGELSICSKSVARGYYKSKVQTEKSFFSSNGLNGYRTGDLVFEKDNLLYYIGRKDFQIKLNGYRIELSDIENNLNKLPQIAKSVVLPISKDGKIEYLAAFIVAGDGMPKSNLKASILVKKELSELVPIYMVPKKIVVVGGFPLNTNGKVDRKKLLEEINL